MSFLDDLAARLPFKLKRRAAEAQYFFAVNISLFQVTAAVWEIFNNRLEINGQATLPSEGTGELVEKTYQALDRAVGALEVEPEKVLFGVPDSWSDKEDLREPYLKLLRKMLKEYELQPLAYVTTTGAISYLLQKEEGIPPTVILLGIGDSVEAALLSAGKVVESHSARGENLLDSVGKVVGQFAEMESLPSRVLLYSTSSDADLTKARDQLMSYQWIQKLSFLHFPKIEVLEEGTALKAVVLAGAVDLCPQVDLRHSFTAGNLSGTGGERLNGSGARSFGQSLAGARPLTDSDTRQAEEADEVSKHPAGAGFIQGDIRNFKSARAADSEDDLPAGGKPRFSVGTSDEEMTDMEREDLDDDKLMGPDKEEEMLSEEEEEGIYAPLPGQVHQGLMQPAPVSETSALPALWLGRLQRAVQGLSFPMLKGGMGASWKLLAPLGLLLILLAVYIFYPKATVTVFVQPRTLEKSAEIVADPAATAVDEQNMIIPGKVVETAVKGSGTIAVTGQKEVGDPAKGQVVIYNLTENPQSFSQGTALSSDSGLKFTLDTSVSIASQSSTIGADFTQTIKPGKSDAVGMTAVQIGPEGNLPAGSQLTVDSKSKSEVVARVEEALSGGTSKQVTVVTANDQAKLKAQVLDTLRLQAETVLKGSVNGDQQVISEALMVTDSSFDFNKEVNDQASQLSVNATAHFKGTAYSEANLRSLVSKLVSTDIPSGYSLDLQSTETQAGVSRVEKDGKLVFQAQFKAELLPTLNLDTLKSSIEGRSIADAKASLKNMDNVIDADVKINPPLPGPLQRLPLFGSHINIDVTPK